MCRGICVWVCDGPSRVDLELTAYHVDEPAGRLAQNRTIE